MTDSNPSADLTTLRDFLYRHLTESVVPFWLRHAIDDAGGINTCIADDGTLVSRDKWLWSQWRAVWVFSKLYNQIDRNPRWLETAEHIYQFATRFGWDEQVQGWRLRLSHDGTVLDGCESIYVDGFAIYGATEFARATGKEEPAALARRTADSVLRRLQAPHDRIPHRPYPVPPGARVHGLPMIFSLVLWELGQLLDERQYRDAALAMTEDVVSNFYRPERDVLLERVASDNREYRPPEGTTIVPGHVLEGMWFRIHILRDFEDRQHIAQACRLIRRHAELGWDTVYGGLFHAIDADGHAEIAWPFPDCKIWWTHTEALYALLLAYECTGEPWCLEWYDRVHEYSFRVFPVAGYGEWRQRLDRRGNPISDTVCLPVKDPFHLPRALIYCIEVLDRLIRRSAKATPARKP